MTITRSTRPYNTAWSPLGTGMDGAVYSLAVHDGKLIAGGYGLQYIASWDGSNWEPLVRGLGFYVRTLAVYNNELIAGGFFLSTAEVSSHIAAWGPK